MKQESSPRDGEFWQVVNANTDSITIDANGYSEHTFTIDSFIPSGYKPIGIVGVTNTGSGRNRIILGRFVLDGTTTFTINIVLHNTNTNSWTGNACFKVLCQKV